MTINKTVTHKFGLDSGFAEIDSSSIDFPVRKSLLFQRQQVNVKINSFSIVGITVPACLAVDKTSLLKLKFVGGVGKEGHSIKNFFLSSYNNPYQLLLNHDAIIDCNNLEQSAVVIKFEVELSFGGGIVTKDYEVEINLIKASPTCDLKFIPEENLKYKPEKTCVGHFEVENSCNYRYADLAALNLTIKYPVQFHEDLVSFAMQNEIVEDNPYYEGSGLREKGEKPTSLLRINRISGQEIELKRFVTQNKLYIPVYIDFEELENPDGEVRNEKFVAIAKNIKNDVLSDPIDCIVPVYRDFTRTGLFVSCNNKMVTDKSRKVYGHYNWIERQTGKKERFNGLIKIADIRIGNEASNKGVSPSSAVIIKNVRITPQFNKHEIISSQDNFLDVVDIAEDQIILKNGIDSYVSYTCKLLHRNIDDIPTDTSMITFKIEFDYIEDIDGSFDEGNGSLSWKPFCSNAVIEIEKDPGSEWLSVDYGTSATVAVFGDGTDNNLQLLKLNERNKDIIEEREREFYRKPRFEEGSYFLSSNIMLQSRLVPTVDSDSLESSLVYLSPSEPIFHSNVLRLPYMKALVGYKSLPNSAMYSEFKYKLHESDKCVLTFENMPLDVDQIFSATYRSLFRDYIMSCLPKGKTVNKIVLSVPNTYTPHHIKCLRRIVEKEIPSLRSDYIWFVSESDAIAYYYLKKWGSFHSETNEVGGYLEHVLVFDMGAGTLDLTYLTIQHLENGDKEVEITAKMGLNKAGNYLDYVLAEALVEEYPDVFRQDILSQSKDDTKGRLLGKLKFFIKNTLKPRLFAEDSLEFSDWNNQRVMDVDFQNVELDLKRIRENANVQRFITECTDDLFDRFTKISNLTMDENPIDTLIMTGRSIQFGGIKKRLMQKINIWNDDNHCKALDISGDELKTIVSQGALYYAALYGKRNSSVVLRNKNVYAKYGVLYVDRKNNWCYQPLIDPNTKPTNTSMAATGQKNGMRIYTFDTDKFSADNTTNYITLDMRNTIEAYLVQCYSPDPAADYADEKRRNDYISVMAVFNPESVSQDNRNVHVRLEINEKNEMTFTAGDLEFEASAPVKIDVETNSTFKHSMWPYA